jgi:hypothetical protein
MHRLAVDWLRLNPPAHPLPLETARKYALAAREIGIPGGKATASSEPNSPARPLGLRERGLQRRQKLGAALFPELAHEPLGQRRRTASDRRVHLPPL